MELHFCFGRAYIVFRMRGGRGRIADECWDRKRETLPEDYLPCCGLVDCEDGDLSERSIRNLCFFSGGPRVVPQSALVPSRSSAQPLPTRANATRRDHQVEIPTTRTYLLQTCPFLSLSKLPASASPPPSPPRPSPSALPVASGREIRPLHMRAPSKIDRNQRRLLVIVVRREVARPRDGGGGED